MYHTISRERDHATTPVRSHAHGRDGHHCVAIRRAGGGIIHGCAVPWASMGMSPVALRNQPTAACNRAGKLKWAV
jgi:hypothetical protein